MIDCGVAKITRVAWTIADLTGQDRPGQALTTGRRSQCCSRVSAPQSCGKTSNAQRAPAPLAIFAS